jgi:hypothetical protein
MTHVFPKETFTFWQFSVGLWGVCPAYFLSKQMAHNAMLLPEIHDEPIWQNMLDCN